ncbi:MAG: tetratricopeptide repeat protein [Bacteroidales bacterium]|nr:tetratricopeptide repeat protein [Bacteroidales bacterium]
MSNIINYNKQEIEELIFMLTDRKKTALIVGYLENEFVAEEIFKTIIRQLPEYELLHISLPDNEIDSISTYIANNLPDRVLEDEKIKHIIHISGLEEHFYTYKNRKPVASPLPETVNAEHKILFRDIPAILFFSLGTQITIKSQKEAPGFWDLADCYFNFYTSKNILISLAEELYYEDKFDESITKIQEALQISDKFDFGRDYNMYFILACNYVEKKQWDNAIKYYKKALKIKPHSDFIWYNLGISYAGKKNYKQAIKCYKKHIEIKPDDDSAWYNMGNVYCKKKKYKQSIKCYKKAVEIKPDNSRIWYNMGNSFFKQKNYKQAIRCYKKTVETEPDNDRAWNSVGYTYLITGNIQKAKLYFNKAVKINNKDKHVFMNFGHINFSQNKTSKAIEFYQKSLSLFEDKESFFTGMKDDYKYLKQYKVNKKKYFEIINSFKILT